jgi:hypothetical protein
VSLFEPTTSNDYASREKCVMHKSGLKEFQHSGVCDFVLYFLFPVWKHKELISGDKIMEQINRVKYVLLDP